MVDSSTIAAILWCLAAIRKASLLGAAVAPDVGGEPGALLKR
jgi:hypothetical protein